VLAGARYGEILGVHAIGDASSEFIMAAAIMVETEMCVADVSEIVFPHPTVSEALREAILAVSSQLSVITSATVAHALLRAASSLYSTHLAVVSGQWPEASS
jgi:hypothetical protein